MQSQRIGKPGKPLSIAVPAKSSQAFRLYSLNYDGPTRASRISTSRRSQGGIYSAFPLPPHQLIVSYSLRLCSLLQAQSISVDSHLICVVPGNPIVRNPQSFAKQDR